MGDFMGDRFRHRAYGGKAVAKNERFVLLVRIADIDRFRESLVVHGHGFPFAGR
ncbi:hypothetical protein SDC9_189740 [bioreactor metagenome]|uniref:Uncharacterized protein n=1 Tax=bioreactor metagenome TaxID=1076179 RepID=A0A645I164_9ZZZZ